MWDCQDSDQDGKKTVEHGIFPSAMDSSDDAYTMALTFGGEMVEKVEHGSFPSTLEVFGVEYIEHTLLSLSYEMVPNPCEHEQWRTLTNIIGGAKTH